MLSQYSLFRAEIIQHHAPRVNTVVRDKEIQDNATAVINGKQNHAPTDATQKQAAVFLQTATPLKETTMEHPTVQPKVLSDATEICFRYAITKNGKILRSALMTRTAMQTRELAKTSPTMTVLQTTPTDAQPKILDYHVPLIPIAATA